MNEYGTHYPVLAELINKFKIQNVLEFGAGNYSTGLFVENCSKVLSIEMQNIEWFEKVKEKFIDNIDSGLLTIKCILDYDGLSSIEYLNTIPNNKFDMVFIDGAGESRYNCANYAKSITDIIVCHDTEYPGYHWENIIIDGSWIWIDIKIYDTWTSVMTKNKKVIKYIKSFNYETLKEKYKDII